MARSTIIAIALAASTLTACSYGSNKSFVNRSLESVHQPVVSRATYVMDIAAPYYGELRGDEAARLDAWFRSMNLRYGDVVYVDDPQGAGDPTRRAYVARIAARYGVVVALGAPVTHGAIPPGAMRVVVSRTNAVVPGCPNWDRPSEIDLAGSTGSNFGCAVNSNLAAMVGNPEHLIHGQDAGVTSDADAAARAISAYKTAPLTGAQGLKTETPKGNN